MPIDIVVKQSISLISKALLGHDEAHGNKVMHQVCDVLASRGGSIGAKLSEALRPDRIIGSMLDDSQQGPSGSYLSGKMDRALQGAEADKKQDMAARARTQQALHHLAQELDKIRKKQQEVFIKKYNIESSALRSMLLQDQLSVLAVTVATAVGASATVVGIVPVAVAILCMVAVKGDEYLTKRAQSIADKAQDITTQKIEQLIKEVLIELLHHHYHAKYPEIVDLATAAIMRATNLNHIIDQHYYGAVLLIESIEDTKAALKTGTVSAVQAKTFSHLVQTQRKQFLDLQHTLSKEQPDPYYKQFSVLAEHFKYSEETIKKILSSSHQHDLLAAKVAIAEEALQQLQTKRHPLKKMLPSKKISAQKARVNEAEHNLSKMEVFRASINPEVLALADKLKDLSREHQYDNDKSCKLSSVLQQLEVLDGRLKAHLKVAQKPSAQDDLGALHPTVVKEVLSPTTAKYDQEDNSFEQVTPRSPLSPSMTIHLDGSDQEDVASPLDTSVKREVLTIHRKVAPKPAVLTIHPDVPSSKKGLVIHPVPLSKEKATIIHWDSVDERDEIRQLPQSKQLTLGFMSPPLRQEEVREIVGHKIEHSFG